MSTGGVFQLINNDGLQDKIIMGTERLRERLKEIMCKKLEMLRKQFPGKSDKELASMSINWAPAISEIEKTHIMFLSSSYKPFVSMAFEYRKTAPTGGSTPNLGQRMIFTMPVYGDFVNDAVINLKLTGLQANLPQDKVRFIEMLGHRIFKKTTFKLAQHELDSYGPEKYNVHWQYKVPVGKENGYLRNIGQEIPKVGLLTADPSVDEVREYRYFGDGPQTFKTVQPTIELWIPLLFWFKDIQTALPNFMFPHGQTDIEIELESEANLVAFANYSGTTSPVYTPPTIRDCFLYMNHIYLLPEIHEIFVKKFGFQLIRVNRLHKISQLTKRDDNILLHDIKWPVETMFVAFKPVANLTNSQRWHRNTVITSKAVKEAVVTGIATVQVNNAVYFDEQPVISSLELRASEITIYPELPPMFYNSYIPYRFGNCIKTPRDLGWNMFNFNVNPGDYQPSGHLNTSSDRELYLFYKSGIDPITNEPYIRQNNPVELTVLAECLNFLYIKGTTAVLRFST
jgi:hypothetical protein